MVVWISHRGLGRNCSENSLQAFDQAVKAGFKWLETDLRCTDDGVLVLSHDSSIKRVFNQDINVENASIDQLENLRTKEGAALVRFSDFVKRYENVGWVLDIKPESAEKTLDILSSSEFFETLNLRLTTGVKFLFWHASVQRRFQERFPAADCFAREDECWRAGLTVLFGGLMFRILGPMGGFSPNKTYAVPPEVFGVNLYNERVFSRYHRKGAKVLAYLPESASLAQQAIAAGADYVLSNTDLFNEID